MIGEAIAAAADRLGSDAQTVLARLAGRLGDDARAAAAALAKLDVPARKRMRAEYGVIARAALPEGFRGVHPSWIEAALEALPARARAALAAGGGEPIDTWLARWASAAIPPMPKQIARPLDEQLMLDASALAQWLRNIGIDQLAFAAGDLAIGELDALRITKAPRLGNLGPRRAAIARCEGVALDDERRYLIIGSRALAPHLADDPIGRLQLTRRMFRPLGILVETELLAHANTPLDQSPSWPALIAPSGL